MTTNRLFMYIQFFLELLVQHNQVFLLQNMPIFYFFYEPIYLNGMIFTFSFQLKVTIFLLLMHLLVFLVLFMCAYIDRSQKVWYAHQHLLKHCLVLNLDECISFYEQNLGQIVFMLYKTVPINVWIYLF